MQLDRDFRSGDETAFETHAGNEYDHKKQMARRTFRRSNHSSRRGHQGAGSATAAANAGGRCER